MRASHKPASADHAAPAAEEEDGSSAGFQMPRGMRSYYGLSDEQIARQGLSGPEVALPHADRLQASFGGEHDLSRVRAHVGGPAARAADALGADAFAADGKVAFRASPSLG